MRKEDIDQPVSEVNDKPEIKNKYGYDLGITIGLIGFITTIAMGFYKIFAYENYNTDDDYLSDSSENVNAYVGGDAYNYIINASYSTGYFVLALVCMVFLCTMLILKQMNKAN